MKKLSYLLPLCGILLITSCKKEKCSVETPESNIHLDKGLLAYFPFNGNINDASGNNNIGVIAGGDLTYDEHGYENSAFNSSQSGDKIVVSNNGSIKFDKAFSVSFNVSVKNPGIQNFVSLVNNNTAKGATFAIGTDLPGNDNLNFGVTNKEASCDEINVEGNTTNNTSEFVLLSEAWYNIVAIFNHGVLKTFVNGKLVSTETSPDSIAHICPEADLIIGGWAKATETSLIGKIDEVRLYDRELNSDEITELAKHFQ